jgi:hypothetical protein
MYFFIYLLGQFVLNFILGFAIFYNVREEIDMKKYKYHYDYWDYDKNEKAITSFTIFTSFCSLANDCILYYIIFEMYKILRKNS